MYLFKNLNISIATANDIPSIKNLLNSAYRGESSRQGWTTEAHLIAGEVRTDEKALHDVLEKDESVILKYTSLANEIWGCVNLQKQGDKLYLGMFSVQPQSQGAGIGKQLLQAADEYAIYMHCTCIYFTVISARTELINWYKRHGFIDTGKRTPFVEDGLTGKHLQPLEFMVMEKYL